MLRTEVTKLAGQLQLQEQIAKSTVSPIAPTDQDVKMNVHDPRPVYALASVGGIVAVFTLLALFAGGGDDRQQEIPVADLSPFDTRPMPTPIPRANGNGAAAAPNPHVDEDAARVAV